MADDTGEQCDKCGVGARIVMIPAIPRYEIDCWGNAIKQVEDGSWARYDDHVASIKSIRSEVEKLEGQIAELNESLWNARIESLDF